MAFACSRKTFRCWPFTYQRAERNSLSFRAAEKLPDLMRTALRGAGFRSAKTATFLRLQLFHSVTIATPGSGCRAAAAPPAHQRAERDT